MNSKKVSVQIWKTVIVMEKKVLECFWGREEISGCNSGTNESVDLHLKNEEAEDETWLKASAE